MKKYNCKYCGKDVMKHVSQVRCEDRVYCNSVCKNNHQKLLNIGEFNPNYRAGTTLETKCSCGKDKDFRAKKCSICSKKSFSVDITDTDEYYSDILQKICDKIENVTSFQQLAEVLKLSRQLVTKISKVNNIDISHFTPCTHRPLPIDSYFVVGDTKRNSTIKRILLENNIKEYKCDICGMGSVWNNKTITLELHHINGNSGDNRLDNLQFVCPNCHSQTDNNKGKNIKKGLKVDNYVK